ncbi:MAG: hypothetical protein NVSMB23_21760 [Myxococcales bacterium]
MSPRRPDPVRAKKPSASAVFPNGAYKNGAAAASGGRSFSLRLRSGSPGKVEALVVLAVVAAVFGVAFLIVQMPGALVVQVRDDAGNPVPDARVACANPAGDQRHSGITDTFGEAKWPGLAKGPWRCELLPPERFHAPRQEGTAVVEPRHPAFWRAVVERPARVRVAVRRPAGAPRAAVAVRAVCPAEDAGSPQSWEARAGVLDGTALLWLPHGRSCRAGLVRPELPSRQPGPVTHPVLSCDDGPCTGPLQGSVGEELSAQLAPTRAQWEAVRPPVEPDPAGR